MKGCREDTHTHEYIDVLYLATDPIETGGWSASPSRDV